MKNREVPMRRCIGCMESRPKGELIRMVYSEGRMVLDPDGKATGRGLYLCPDEKCIQKAVKKKAFNRSVRGEVKSEDIESILKELASEEK